MPLRARLFIQVSSWRDPERVSLVNCIEVSWMNCSSSAAVPNEPSPETFRPTTMKLRLSGKSDRVFDVPVPSSATHDGSTPGVKVPRHGQGNLAPVDAEGRRNDCQCSRGSVDRF